MTTIDFPPQLALQQLIQGFQVTQCLYVAAKLGIADLLKEIAAPPANRIEGIVIDLASGNYWNVFVQQ